MKYIALIDLDFCWKESHVKLFDQMYNDGATIHDLKAKFKRPHEEIACLIMDRALKGKIQRRKEPLFDASTKTKPQKKSTKTGKEK